MKRIAVGTMVALGAAAGAARADVPLIRTYKWVGTQPIGTPPPSQPALLSHTLYLNNCKSGCTVYPGTDDSLTMHSSIPTQTSTLSAFAYSDATWQQVVQCVQQTFAPFDIQIVTTKPTSGNYFEEIVAGTAADVQLGGQGIGGIAPYECGVINNAITFDFANEPYYNGNVAEICWTAAQEASHAFGLDHEDLASDPMTYLQGSLPKRFQNKAAPCGSDCPTLSPWPQCPSGSQQRQCFCGGSTQNSYQMLLQTLGSASPTPPKVTITAPTNGATVQPGFPVHADVTDDGGVSKAELYVDGQLVKGITVPPFAFNAPATLTPGTHHVEVRGYDLQDTPGSAFIDVVIGNPCTQSGGCTGDDVCVDGRCVAGPSASGGLGSPCTKATDCASGECATGGDQMLCVENCDPTSSVGCPSGFGCDGGAKVCWPNGDTGTGTDGTVANGCDAGGAGAGAPIGVGAVLAAFGLRRRRARA